MSKKKKQQKTPLGRLIDLPSALLTFIREARDELRKVTWPSRQTTIRYTIIVIVASVGVGFLIGGMDYLFQLGLESII